MLSSILAALAPSRETSETNCVLDEKNSLGVSKADLLAVALIFVGGLSYYWNAHFWSIGFIGDSQWGDAEFWLNGALHLARGIVDDNPGKGFRPGYFVITGAALAFLGPSFLVYYKVFLVFFLGAAAGLYFALRSMLGRLGAFVAIAMSLFSPYTAEWTATATTDATGLALHLISLSFLIASASKRFAIKPLLAFGFVFSLAELTRPLMLPFLIAVCGLILFAPSALRQRFRLIVAMTIAFAFPLISWVAIQKLTVDEYSVSQNDAGTYLAASDPKIQVWSPTMFADVTKSAQRRLGKENISAAEINDECRMLTVRNYLNPKNLEYHIKRLWANLWTVADFSLLICGHPGYLAQSAILCVLLAAMVIDRLLARRFLSAFVAVTLLVSAFIWWEHFGLFTIVATALAFIDVVGCKKDMTPAVVALYWLVGQFTFFIVGGTWATEAGHLNTYSMNALGYRLGMQFFFCTGLLAVYLAYRLVYGSAFPLCDNND